MADKHHYGRTSMHVSPDGVIRKCTNPEACPYKDNSMKLIMRRDADLEKTVIGTAAEVFHDELMHLPRHHVAVEDMNARRLPLSDPLLGWMPSSTRTRNLLHKAGLADDGILEAGLADLNDSGGLEPYTSNRLSILINNEDGSPFAIYARSYTSHRKYIRSYPASSTLPEYDTKENLYKGSYHNVLFLADRAKDEAKRNGELYIVEGQFDALACQYGGLGNVVGAGGCDNFFEDNYEDAMRLTGNGKIIMCLDSDAAGIKGMRTIARRFPNADIDAVLLPAGMDPCDIRSKMGDRALKSMMGNHRPILDFLAESTKPADAPALMAGMNDRRKRHFASMVASRSGADESALIRKSEKMDYHVTTHAVPYREQRRWVKNLGMRGVQHHDHAASIAERCRKSSRFSLMAGLVATAHDSGHELPENIVRNLPKTLRNPDGKTLAEARANGRKGGYDELMGACEDFFRNRNSVH